MLRSAKYYKQGEFSYDELGACFLRESQSKQVLVKCLKIVELSLLV